MELSSSSGQELGLVGLIEGPLANCEICPPWETTRVRGAPVDFFKTIRDVLLEPHLTFARMPTRGHAARATGFLGLILAIWAIFMAVGYLFLAWTIVAIDAISSPGFRPEPGRTWVTSLQILAGCSVFAAAYLVLNLFMASVHHGVLKILGGGNRGFLATYKVICYAHAAGIFNVVWFCGGGLLVIPFYFASGIIGLRRVHGAESWKAVASMIVPFVFLGAFLGISVITLWILERS
jgi:hypothetical protein